MANYSVTVRVNPRSSKNELKFEGGILHAKLTAPPVEGAANAACCELIADTLGIAKSRVGVVKGQKSRLKVVAVEGFEGEWPWK
jgi:uncharacterized protein YggU (UPF0235/DUF167 family)